MRISSLPEVEHVAVGGELAALAVLLPRPKDFPDPWRPDLDGPEVMLERLLTYAGLGDVPFRIDPLDGEEALLDHVTGWHRSSGAVAFSAGRDDDGALRVFPARTSRNGLGNMVRNEASSVEGAATVWFGARLRVMSEPSTEPTEALARTSSARRHLAPALSTR